jgi:hypothetical protein
MKKIFLLGILMLASFPFFAQGPASIVFVDKAHDFGNIAEEDGSVSYEFSFTNVGLSPLVVSQVTASCGCTTPNWTKEPVAAGKTGTIKVTYNAKGRPGQFSKTITVFSNAKEGNVLLNIKGVVNPKTASIEESYPFSISELRLKSFLLSFYDVSTKGQKTDKIEVLNTSKSSLSVRFDRVPAHLLVVANPATLQPGVKGEIQITYKGSTIKDWGARNDDIYVLLNNESRIASDRKIVVSANIVEDFLSMTPEQRAIAPIIEVSSAKADFGVVKSGDKKTLSILVTNGGKSTLHIRKIICENISLQAKLDRMSIPVGKSATLKITLLPSKIRSGLNEKVTLISNDPSRPNIPIRVIGSI